MFNFFKRLFFRSNIQWSSSLSNDVTVGEESREEAEMLVTAGSLIAGLLNWDHDADAAVVANNWIDSPKVHIRENYNNDFTIDYFLERELHRKPALHYDGPLYQDACKFVEEACLDNGLDREAMLRFMDDKLSQLKQRIKAELDHLIDSQLQQKFGLSFSLDVLAAINDQNEAFMGEMTQERASIRDVSLPRAMADIEHFCSALSDKPSLFRGHQSLREKLDAAIHEACLCRRDIWRRDYAIAFFTWLRLQLLRRAFSLRQVASSLSSLKYEVNIRLTDLMILDGSDHRPSVAVVPRPVDVGAFIGALPASSLLSIPQLSAEELQRKVFDFVKSDRV